MAAAELGYRRHGRRRLGLPPPGPRVQAARRKAGRRTTRGRGALRPNRPPLGWNRRLRGGGAWRRVLLLGGAGARRGIGCCSDLREI
ncbi:hypothetical protein ACP70R_042577 [Stipagrostis hirtigluma subsp. patula]